MQADSMGPDRRADATAGPMLTSECRAALRRAIDRHVNGATEPDELPAALRALCAEAKASAMPPEQLIVAFKMICDEIIGRRRALPPEVNAEALRAHLVTACIEEFYRSGRSD